MLQVVLLLGYMFIYLIPLNMATVNRIISSTVISALMWHSAGSRTDRFFGSSQDGFIAFDIYPAADREK